jgi:hypothetical protein
VTRTQIYSHLPTAVLALIVCLGIYALVLPLFVGFAPTYVTHDYVNHLALVAAARETLVTTHALPISSHTLVPGVEYPYFLFGNAGFYVLAAIASLLIDSPSYVGARIILALVFALGAFATFVLARRSGVHPYLSVALGFLYASGPYLTLNLWIRVAFPEYLAWQVLPGLLLVLRWALQARPTIPALIAGAAALALPFYIHKLTAPYVILTLGTLALNNTPRPRARTLLNLMAMGAAALGLSAPAWSPMVRGLDAERVADLAFNPYPLVLDSSLVDLFWPIATNSLKAYFPPESYDGRFALQVGVVPTIGVLAAIWTLVTQPRLAVGARLLIPLLIFVGYVALILGSTWTWNLIPAPLRSIQFSYRLIGLAHFVGFVLLIQSLGPASQRLVRCSTGLVGRVLSIELIGLALLSGFTYWAPLPTVPVDAANIQPRDLRDMSRFFPSATRSTLMSTGRAIAGDYQLSVPPFPIPIDSGTRPMVLAGTVPPFVAAGGAVPLTVEVYGLAERLSTTTPLPEVQRTGTRLAGMEVTSDTFELPIPITPETKAIAIRCSRTVVPATQVPGSGDTRQLCIQVEYLAAPNEGDRFIIPGSIPEELLTRSALGTTRIDARQMTPGHYLLPTFYYPFVRVTGPDAAIVPIYQFNGRAIIRHSDQYEWYVMTYALEPELIGFLSAFVIVVAYALMASKLRRPILDPRGRRSIAVPEDSAEPPPPAGRPPIPRTT